MKQVVIELVEEFVFEKVRVVVIVLEGGVDVVEVGIPSCQVARVALVGCFLEMTRHSKILHV